MTTTNTPKSVQLKKQWDNAIAMASHSLVDDGDVSPIVPKNFTNGKNAAPRGIQNYDLALMQFVEGYSTNLWATPRQISKIGGVISENAPHATIFIEKKSKAGTTFYKSYSVVNLDEVSFPDPNKLSDDAYKMILDTAEVTEEFAVPSPTSFEPDYESMRKKKDTAPKKETAPKALANVPKRNVLDKRDATSGTAPGGHDIQNVKLDFDEFGIHVEARTVSEAQLMLDIAVKAYLQLKK